MAGRKAHCVLQRADAAVINHGTIVLSDGQPCQSRFVGKRRSFSPETRWRRTGPTGPEPSLARGEAGGSRHCCRRLCMHWLLPTECRLPRPLSLTMPMLSIVWPPAQRRDIPIGGCIKKKKTDLLVSTVGTEAGSAAAYPTTTALDGGLLRQLPYLARCLVVCVCLGVPLSWEEEQVAWTNQLIARVGWTRTATPFEGRGRRARPRRRSARACRAFGVGEKSR